MNALPDDLQSIVRNAAKVVNVDMLAEYTARNNQALQTLVNEHQVQLRKLPDEVLDTFRVLSDEVVAELANKNALATKIHNSYASYREQVMQWSAISDTAYLNVRGGV